MSKVIPNPELIIKNLVKKLYMGLEDETYDPKKTIGSQLKGPGFLQRQFWEKFIDAFNARFSGETYDTQALWKAFLDQDINPFHVEHLILNKSYTRKEKSARLVQLHNPLALPKEEGGVGPVEYIRQWDALLDRTQAFVAPYELDDQVIAPDALVPKQHFFASALQSEHTPLFMYASRHYEDYLHAWVDGLSRYSSKDRVAAAKKLIETICDSGIMPSETARAVGYMGPALLQAATLLQKVDFGTELDAGYLSINLPRALLLHFPQPMARVEPAKAIMAMKLPEATAGALESLLLEPEYAVEALSSIEPEAALEAFGKELRSAIGNGKYHTINSLPQLIAVVETYRELFIQYGIGDIKGHACLDALCTSLESAQHFAELGYIRQKPVLHYHFTTSTCAAFTDRLTETSEEGMLLQKAEVDKLLDVLAKLDAIHTLRPDLEAYFKNDMVPGGFMTRPAFGHLVVRLIERALVDVNELLRTETRLKKVQALGVDRHALEGVKVFDKHLDNYLSRDLGL
ncbi:hypothetical protein [Pseudomonas sp. S1(2024)]|uniref:hypothetical protein n=1 Tax=Pseudomonas sp. S1(2024) TaxID=3390191 RepID=UPI00397D42C0